MLRFDLPGTGNSSGSPSDDDLVTAWLGAVEAAAAWLGENGGRRRLAVLGLGLGGLLAMEAARAGAKIDDLVLWAAPLKGRSFIREARNFVRLQSWSEAEDEAALPDGSIEVSGFLLTGETIARLETLDPYAAPGAAPRRALLLGRHGIQAPGPLSEWLEASGCEVAFGDGKGWGAMVSHPERARLPDDVVARVDAWLVEGDSGGEGGEAVSVPHRDPTAEDRADRLELEVDGVGVSEEPFCVELSFGRTFGILAECSGQGRVAGLCAVFLNAGAVRDTGPNRMWVERSRAWAARGVSSLRVDLECLGEGGGDPAGLPPGEEYFSERFQPQIAALLDALQERGTGSEFVLVGLCSGAYQSYRATLRDDRVRAATLINPHALIWRRGLLSERELRMNLGVLDGKRVARMFRGGFGRKQLLTYASRLAHGATGSVSRLIRRRGRPRKSWQAELEEELDRFGETDKRLLVGFSGKEPLPEEFEEVEFPIGKWQNIEVVDLPGEDHTLRAISSQAFLRELLDARLEQEIARFQADREPEIAAVETANELRRV